MSYKLRRALALLLAALLLSMTLSGCGMPAALIDELIEDKDEQASPSSERIIPLTDSYWFDYSYRGYTAYEDMPAYLEAPPDIESYTDLLRCFTSGGEYQDFEDAYFLAQDELYRIYTAYTVADISYSSDPADEAAAAVESAYAAWYAASDEFYAALGEVARSEHGASLLDELLGENTSGSFASYYPDESGGAEHSAEDELLHSYNVAMTSSEPDLQRAAEIFVELVKLRNEQAAAYGYSSYAELAYYEQYYRNYSPEEVAASVSLSSSHFSRQFKAKTGYSPYEYIILRRIDKAKKAAKGDKKFLQEAADFEGLRDWLNDGKSARSYEEVDIAAEYPDCELLSLKPVIYAANLDEDGFADPAGVEYYNQVADRAAAEGAQVIPVCAKLEAEIAELEPEEKKPAAAAAAPAGAIPPGTVIGDGHIKIAHVRIDTRLLHGQVATTWTKQINPNRIIVVSDGVAHDELRKTMIEQAAPPGVHANVVPIKKMAEVVKDTRFGDTKAMLLFENPQDLLKAIEAGVDIKEVNIGSMAHSKGKVVVTNAVAMGDDDVKTLEALKAKGVKFEVRKVPSDSSEDLDAMLKKAKAELAAQA